MIRDHAKRHQSFYPASGGECAEAGGSSDIDVVPANEAGKLTLDDFCLLVERTQAGE